MDRQAEGELGQGFGWLGCGSELGAVDRPAVGEFGQGVGWLSCGSELGAVDRQAGGEMGQAVGWLGSATECRQCLTCGGRTGQVAKQSGLRKEGHNTGRVGNGGETGGNSYLVEGACML